MSVANEIQDEMDDEFTTAMKWIWAILSAMVTSVAGIVLGAFVGFYGLYYFCVFMGEVYVQAGWGFLFITVPGGMLAGGILGGCLPFFFIMKWR